MATHTAFYAYPSRPWDIRETIENAIKDINSGNVVAITPWRNLRVSGKVIITEVMKAIDEADIFACDMTNINENVLFELGYALGRGKRPWLTLNTTVGRATFEYRRLGALTPFGYSAYKNQGSLVEAFYTDEPWRDLGDGPLALAYNGHASSQAKPSLLYLRSEQPTDASLALSAVLDQFPFFRNIIVDDPAEVPSQTLSWYMQRAREVDAVVVHMASDDHANARWHNAKCALVSGLACGFGKQVLMLAHAPHKTAIDYADRLRVHDGATQCRGLAAEWLTATEEVVSSHWRSVRDHESKIRRSAELANLSVGEAVAELEEDELSEYFVETSSYLEALAGRQTIFVGRKGTGKTANMYAIVNRLGSDRRNYICVIKPVDYEVEGILRMLKQSISVSEKGYLVESLWKYLIYTEIAMDVFHDLQSRPEHYRPSAGEQQLLTFVTDHVDLIMPPFSVRLQSTIEKLCDLEGVDPGNNQRARISQILHESMLRDLRDVLGQVLEGRERVAILVDNLDKAWGEKEDVRYLSDMIFGLLSVSRRIADEFRASDHWRKRVNLSLTVFLRSDIFSVVQSFARERDKLMFHRIVWDDEELLIRIVEERLSNSFGLPRTPEEIWDEFFVPTVQGRPTKEFLTTYTIPRPRDIIFLVQAAIAGAIDRRHPKVEEADFISARAAYSEHALNSLIAEDDPQFGKLEDVLYEFAGASERLTRAQIESFIMKAGVQDEGLHRYVTLLIELNFLGIKTREDRVEFPLDDRRLKILRKIADTVENNPATDHSVYAINPAYHPILEIRPVG